MYNGRQRHIRTESVQDRSVKQESVHGHRSNGGCGERALRHVKKQKEFPAMKTKHLAEREMYKEQKKTNKRKDLCSPQKKSSMQCYIWFHSCKLDCIYVTIAYAIR